MKNTRNLFAASAVFTVMVTLTACGGGGSGGSGPPPDITTPPTTVTVVPPTTTVTVVPPPVQVEHDFSKCYFTVPGALDTACLGGAEGHRETRELAKSLFASGKRVDTDKKDMLVDGGNDATHQRRVTGIANLYNQDVNGDDVGGTVIGEGFANSRLLSDALKSSRLSNIKIVSVSAATCMGAHIPGCLDPTSLIGRFLVNAAPNGDNSMTPRTIDLSMLTDEQVKTMHEANAIMWSVGLTPEGNLIHPSSGTCGEELKNWCAGAYFLVASLGGTVDANGVYKGLGTYSGNSYSVLVLASMVKFGWELYPDVDPKIIRNYICATATDLGAPGNDAVYGCGAVNLSAFYDKYGKFIGTVGIPGLNGLVFNSVKRDPVLNHDFLSPNQKVSLLQDEETGSAAACIPYGCVGYSKENEAPYIGVGVSGENGHISIHFVTLDNFYGGEGTGESDFGDVNYGILSLASQQKINSYNITFGCNVAKGSADGGGRIDRLDGTYDICSIEAKKGIGNANISLGVSNANFRGDATIGGNDYNLGDNEFKLFAGFEMPL